tara:strand:+ start:288 stop:446 length:159 start_codon:yes stop_codon:yes gene_type:complete
MNGARSIYAGYTIECTTAQKWRGTHPSKIGGIKLKVGAAVLTGATLAANSLY